MRTAGVAQKVGEIDMSEAKAAVFLSYANQDSKAARLRARALAFAMPTADRTARQARLEVTP